MIGAIRAKSTRIGSWHRGSSRAARAQNSRHGPRTRRDHRPPTAHRTVPHRRHRTDGVVERLRAVEVHVLQASPCRRPPTPRCRRGMERLLWQGAGPAGGQFMHLGAVFCPVRAARFRAVRHDDAGKPQTTLVLMGGMSPPGFTIVLDRRSTSSDDVFQAHSEASAPSSTASKTTVSPRATSPKAVPTKAGA